MHVAHFSLLRSLLDVLDVDDDGPSLVTESQIGLNAHVSSDVVTCQLDHLGLLEVEVVRLHHHYHLLLRLLMTNLKLQLQLVSR